MRAEREYLQKHHPELLASRNIDAIREVATARSELAKFYNADNKQELQKHEGFEARAFFDAESLADHYTTGDHAIPELALPHLNYMKKQFFVAYQQSMEMKARATEDPWKRCWRTRNKRSLCQTQKFARAI